MKNTFGNSITTTLFGESHGEAIGVVLDGLPAGLKVDESLIEKRLAQRRPSGKISTSRREPDNLRILSGVFEGHTKGTPLAIAIENSNTKSKDYDKNLPRPGHADFAAECKYHGFQDYRGGGHFSGRITAALVAAAAIVEPALEVKGIKFGTHISKLHGIEDREFENYEKDILELSEKEFPCLSEVAEREMIAEIERAREDGDSVGGILESAILGLPAGLGEPWFDSMESMISHMLFSIGGIKAVEFGSGFAMAEMFGSQANDNFEIAGGNVVTSSNNNGGINGGISNGMPVIIRCAVKPTPSIFKEQQTVNLENGKNETLQIKGRHDPAIIHRAKFVVDAALRLVVADMLCQRFGTDYLAAE